MMFADLEELGVWAVAWADAVADALLEAIILEEGQIT